MKSCGVSEGLQVSFKKVLEAFQVFSEGLKEVSNRFSRASGLSRELQEGFQWFHIGVSEYFWRLQIGAEGSQRHFGGFHWLSYELQDV